MLFRIDPKLQFVANSHIDTQSQRSTSGAVAGKSQTNEVHPKTTSLISALHQSTNQK
jgi:hypothetical protein